MKKINGRLMSQLSSLARRQEYEVANEENAAESTADYVTAAVSRQTAGYTPCGLRPYPGYPSTEGEMRAG